MLISKLGVSAVSHRVIECALEYAERERWPVMVVASRNQVEDADLGAGYTRLTMRDLVARARALAPNFGVVCRDHGGPYFSDSDAGLSAGEAAERAMASLRSDIAAGVDLVHVDWSRGGRDVAGETVRIVQELCGSVGDKVKFEVGADETDGGVDDVADFGESLAAFADLLGIAEFVVGRTGTLVRECFQVGYFDLAAVRYLTAMAHDSGFRFKEHNADYLSPDEVALRPMAGIDAINIGPELGVLETATIGRLAMLYGADRQLDAFYERAVASGKWRKWAYAENPPRHIKALVAGHYNQHSPEYQELIDSLEERVGVEEVVRGELTSRIDCYARALKRTSAYGAALDPAV